jgi:hypothetical protein
MLANSPGSEVKNFHVNKDLALSVSCATLRLALHELGQHMVCCKPRRFQKSGK